MKTLSKEEILARITGRHLSQVNEGCFNMAVSESLQAMQEFSDQENARLTAINAKKAELIEAYQTLQRYTSMDESLNLSEERMYDKLKEKLNQFELELASLQWKEIDDSGVFKSPFKQEDKEADNCIHFDECQGRDKCLTDKVKGNKCIGVDCGEYNDKK